MQANVTELSRKIHPTDNQDSEAYSTLTSLTHKRKANRGRSAGGADRTNERTATRVKEQASELWFKVPWVHEKFKP